MDARLTLFEDGALHVTHDESVRAHRAQAWKIVVAIDGELELRTRRGAGTARVLVVPPFVEQSIERRGLTVAYFAEPGSALAPFALGIDDVTSVAGRDAEGLVAIGRDTARSRPDEARDATSAAFARLALPAARPVDRRVTRALVDVAAAPDRSIAEIAAGVGLSDVRLRHLVRDATHLSLRTHRLWHRTMRGVEGMLAGLSPARAAAAAGFADQPHFTRAFTGFFGRTPSSLRTYATILAPWIRRDLRGG